jgi:hypothetical protein
MNGIQKRIRDTAAAAQQQQQTVAIKQLLAKKNCDPAR